MGVLKLHAPLPAARAADIKNWIAPPPPRPAANDNIAAGIRAEWKTRLPSCVRGRLTDGEPLAAVNDNDADPLVDLVRAAFRQAAAVERSLPGDRPQSILTYWPQARRSWSEYGTETAKPRRFRATPAQISRMDFLFALLLRLPTRERRLIYDIAHGRTLRTLAADLGQTVHRVRSDHRLALRCIGVLVLTGRLPGQPR